MQMKMVKENAFKKLFFRLMPLDGNLSTLVFEKYYSKRIQEDVVKIQDREALATTRAPLVRIQAFRA